MADKLSTKRPKLAVSSGEESHMSNCMLLSAGALGTIASAAGAILPVLVGLWQTQNGLSVEQAGLVAATELLAQVFGTGVFLWASQRWSLRTIGAAGLVGMLVGNIASAASGGFHSLVLARAFGGTGGGLARALSMMCLARALTPGRAFAIYAGAQMALASLTTAGIPHLIASLGSQAPFLALAVGAIIGFALCPFLPKGSTPSSGDRRRSASPASALFAIAALFIYFVGQGALWTYLKAIGDHQSISAAGITYALTFLNIAGFVGALGAGAFARRVNPRAALLILLATETLSIVGLFNSHTAGLFIASACGYNFSWCASFPFQFTVIAQSDTTGRASSVVPAADGLGLAGGAALAGVVLPTLGLESAGAICEAASAIGVGLYITATMFTKMPSNEKPPPADSDVATLER